MISSEQKLKNSTGRQGGAVCRSLLESKQNFKIRAITRNALSEKARELSDLGAEVVQANGFNNDEMLSALAGVWGFWLNTNRYDPVIKISTFVLLKYVRLLINNFSRRFSPRMDPVMRNLGEDSLPLQPRQA